MQAARSEVAPDRITQLALGFMGSKVLLSAVELGLFTELAKGPADAATLGTRLGLHPRSSRDFLDTLVATGMLRRDEDGMYSNTSESDLYLDGAKPTYLGGLLQMINQRLYGYWGNLTEALRTGLPQNEAKSGGDLFESIYHSPEALRRFLGAMTGLSMVTGKALASKFPWSGYRAFCDVGCAQGAVTAELLEAHPHLRGMGFDLPKVKPVFDEYLAGRGFNGRARFTPGNFFEDPLPSTDVLVMGHILHDWDLPAKRMLVKKAYDALPPGGALVVYDAIIDDERSKNVGGLLMSLNMLIETPGGFDYTGAEGKQWLKEAGFRQTMVEPLAGIHSMLVGIK